MTQRQKIMNMALIDFLYHLTINAPYCDCIIETIVGCEMHKEWCSKQSSCYDCICNFLNDETIYWNVIHHKPKDKQG